jgi:hypothetical protein
MRVFHAIQTLNKLPDAINLVPTTLSNDLCQSRNGCSDLFSEKSAYREDPKHPYCESEAESRSLKENHYIAL